jgi:hypothetical protein
MNRAESSYLHEAFYGPLVTIVSGLGLQAFKNAFCFHLEQCQSQNKIKDPDSDSDIPGRFGNDPWAYLDRQVVDSFVN